ncbi:hypothetical protein chiPu_0020217 [Chiloscyllium punctatum]|uniref:Radiation-inducible immediate-early gene IEX-1 n=1 Tax=Chiloscyllium punctatum TaxID=137246 RepID=A0A401RUD6_CHIPU|nr:hypothetical protein [Chiloscyllium punctatum]
MRSSHSLPLTLQLHPPAGQPYSLSSRRSTDPEIFTFEPIPEHKPNHRGKRRSLKVLYPLYQSRKSLPTKKDMAKRLYLLLLSIVILQVYSATEPGEEEAGPISEAPRLETSNEEPSPPAQLVFTLDSAAVCILTVPGGTADNTTVRTL